MAWLKPVHFRPSWGSVYLESWRLWLWTLRKTLWSRPAPQSSCACCPQHRGKTLSNRRPPSQTDKPLDKREKYLSIRTLGFLVISTLVCAVIVLLSFVSEVPYPSGWGTREAFFFFGYVRVHKEGWGQKVFFFKRTAVPYLERRETRWVPLPNVVGGHVKFLSYCGRGHVKFPYLRWGGGTWISPTWGGWGTLEVPLPKVGGGHVKLSPWNSLAIKISVLYLWTLSQLAHWKISSMFLMLLQITIIQSQIMESNIYLTSLYLLSFR